MARQADRLNAIIEDLLTLSKIEQSADTTAVPMEPSPLMDILQAAATNCRTKAQEANVSIDIDCDNRLSVTANAPLLEQAITNLLDNAIKYSPAGAGVTMSARIEKRQVAIRVADTGIGIDEQFIPRLFERFYRVDKARSRKLGGTGLGLAIVKHIVQTHRGRIEVQSTPGKGSTFTVFLPAEANDKFA